MWRVTRIIKINPRCTDMGTAVGLDKIKYIVVINNNLDFLECPQIVKINRPAHWRSHECWEIYKKHLHYFKNIDWKIWNSHKWLYLISAVEKICHWENINIHKFLNDDNLEPLECPRNYYHESARWERYGRWECPFKKKTGGFQMFSKLRRLISAPDGTWALMER